MDICTYIYIYIHIHVYRPDCQTYVGRTAGRRRTEGGRPADGKTAGYGRMVDAWLMADRRRTPGAQGADGGRTAGG